MKKIIILTTLILAGCADEEKIAAKNALLDKVCITLSDANLESIEGDLKLMLVEPEVSYEPVAIKVLSGQAVKSREHKNAYYAAIEYTHEGMHEAGIAHWALTGHIEDNSIFSPIGHVSAVISKNHRFNEDIFSYLDEGARLSKDCISFNKNK